MTGREGPGPERPGPDYPPEWDSEPVEQEYERLAVLGGYGLPAARAQALQRDEVTRERGECLADPLHWCRWNPECRSCAPVAGSRHDPSAVAPDPWTSQGPVPPPPL